MTTDLEAQRKWGVQTRLVRGGTLRSEFGETNEAIFVTSGYVYESAEEAEQSFNGQKDRFVYSRFKNPTVEMFEKQSPDAPTNKPVCFDCHGVHDIKSAKDPNSSVFKTNLLKTCQQCHPNATANFPSSWLNHYDASPSQFPVIYFVNLFYTIIIPLVIGGMAAFVLLDAARRIRNRVQKGSH